MLNSGRFISASAARIVYNVDKVTYYEVQNDNKVKVRFDNGESKDLEGADAQHFLAAITREPLSPGQAA